MLGKFAQKLTARRYFVIGNLANNDEEVIRYAGLLRGTESAVQAVSVREISVPSSPPHTDWYLVRPLKCAGHGPGGLHLHELRFVGTRTTPWMAHYPPIRLAL